MNYDRINITGNISKINDDNESKFIWFDICKNERYKNNEGKEKEIISFFSAKINRKKVNNNELFKMGSWITITGIPKSYIDEEKKKRFYIFVLQLDNPKIIFKDEKSYPKILCDKDNVMLWNNKRCESSPLTKEEKEKFDEILSKYED